MSSGVHVSSGSQHDAAKVTSGVTVAALGVVFGDIGTSPLYTLQTCLSIANAAPTMENLLGVLSLLVWALILVVCLKYATIVMRVEHNQEGGILALLAALRSSLGPYADGTMKRPRWYVVSLLIVVIGGAMLFGDGVITPAISVISAVEGIGVATSAAQPWIVPVSVVILVFLFSIQFGGTGRVGLLFGPVMILWFLSIAIVGAIGLVSAPAMLWAFDPRHAIGFLLGHQLVGFLVLGGVVLAVTGVEALYADLSHFGRKAIVNAWYLLVFPALLLNYLGQGAHLLVDPKAMDNPFYALAPSWGLWPMVVLATFATIIASQALISGAFTLTEQAIALNLCPRMKVSHTSRAYPGQVYVPAISIVLGIACVVLVLMFRSSARLAEAYGLAVSVTMFATSVAFYEVVSRTRGWRWWQSVPTLIGFIIIDGTFVIACLPKFMDGGYVPFAIALVIAVVALTWLDGRRNLAQSLISQQEPITEFIRALVPSGEIHGTMVFLTPNLNGMPYLGKHAWLRSRARYERVVLLRLVPASQPSMRASERVEVRFVPESVVGPQRDVDPRSAARLVTVEARFGYMERLNIGLVIEACQRAGLDLSGDDVAFFYADPKIRALEHHGMPWFRRELFRFLNRAARRMPDDLGIAPERQVELGVEVAL